MLQSQLVGSNIITLVGHTTIVGGKFKIVASGSKVVIDAGVEVGGGSGSHPERLSWNKSKVHRPNVRLKEALWYWDSLGLMGSPGDRQCVGQGH